MLVVGMDAITNTAIDGTIATIMELDSAIRCGNAYDASVYNDRGILPI
jgi:hypothetical protein